MDHFLRELIAARPTFVHRTKHFSLLTVNKSFPARRLPIGSFVCQMFALKIPQLVTNKIQLSLCQIVLIPRTFTFAASRTQKVLGVPLRGKLVTLRCEGSIQWRKTFTSDFFQTLLEELISCIVELQPFYCDLLLIPSIRCLSLLKRSEMFSLLLFLAIFQILQLWFYLAEERYHQGVKILAFGDFNFLSLDTLLKLLYN